MTQKRIALFLALPLAAGFFAEPGLAQTPLAGYGKHQFPHVKVEGAPHLVDVDRDGDLDVVFAGSTVDRIFLNNGEAIFTEATKRLLPKLGYKGKSRSVISGDIDGDGDADLFFSSEGQNRLYLNDGKGRFKDVTSQQLPQRRGQSRAARFVDIDGDKDLDLVIANGHAFVGFQSRVYRNNGKGFYTDITATHAPKVRDKSLDLVVGDFDGNGTPDVFFIDLFPSTGRHLWLNDGKGKFKDASSQLPAIKFTSTGVDAADIDQDKDLDLVFLFPNSRPRFFRNKGKAWFEDDTQKVMPASPVNGNRLKLVDLDRDGDMDLIATSWQGPAILYLFDKGRFGDLSILLQPNNEGGGDLAVGDLDGDMDPDFILNGKHTNTRLYLGVTPGRFIATVQFQDAAREFHGVSTARDGYGDFDGDGDLDILNAESRLRLGDGTGSFQDAPKGAVPPLVEKGVTVAIADVNGDGKLDAWIGTAGLPSMKDGQDRLYFGDGKGHFSDATFLNYPKTDTYTYWGEFADLDADGDLDLVFVDGNAWKPPISAFLNDGKGKFTPGKLKLPPTKNAVPTMVDVDGDGDLDMVLSVAQLWLNDGKGSYRDVTATQIPSPGQWMLWTQAGDIDGDGDLDLLFTNRMPKYPQTLYRSGLYLNNGKGFFKDVSSRLGSITSPDLRSHLVDIDDDGDLDVLSIDAWPRSGTEPNHRVWINDGKGQFQEDARRRMHVEGRIQAPVRRIDIDHDGDQDYISAERLLLNRHRQIEAPWLARLGTTWALDYYSEAGVAKGPALAVAWFGSRKAHLSFPGLGIFGIDPRSMVQGPVVSIPAKTGWTRVTTHIPSDGALAGQTLYVQALIVSRFQTLPGTWKLSNVLIEPIYR